jgi:hypothetical protein
VKNREARKMDFEDTAQEAKFRAEVRAFLDANAKRKDASAVTGYRAGHDRPEALTRAKEWQAKKFKAGYAGITLP